MSNKYHGIKPLKSMEGTTRDTENDKDAAMSPEQTNNFQGLRKCLDYHMSEALPNNRVRRWDFRGCRRRRRYFRMLFPQLSVYETLHRWKRDVHLFLRPTGPRYLHYLRHSSPLCKVLGVSGLCIRYQMMVVACFRLFWCPPSNEMPRAMGSVLLKTPAVL